MHRSPLLAPPASLLGNCPAYVFRQPTLPLLTGRGQAEVGTSFQARGRLGATAAYSPIPRVGVLGGLTGLPARSKQRYLGAAQHEVKAGLYQPLGCWLLGAPAGYSQAYNHRDYELGIFGGSHELETSYRKQFAQLGIANLG